jgi:hypothetical protein
MYGKVLLTGGEIMEVRNWNVNDTAAWLDATSMGANNSNGYKEGKFGLKEVTGDFEAIKFVSLVGSILLASLFVGTAASTTQPVWVGSIGLKQDAVANPHDNLTTFKYSFNSTGSYSWVTS